MSFLFAAGCILLCIRCVFCAQVLCGAAAGVNRALNQQEAVASLAVTCHEMNHDYVQD